MLGQFRAELKATHCIMVGLPFIPSAVVVLDEGGAC